MEQEQSKFLPRGSFCHGELDDRGTLKHADGVVCKEEFFPFLLATSSNRIVNVVIGAEDETGEDRLSGK